MQSDHVQRTLLDKQFAASLLMQIDEKSSSSDTIQLTGDDLVRELGLTRSNDTLGRWLAHHLAELMAAVDLLITLNRRKRDQQE